MAKDTELVGALRELLADVVSLYLKAHGYHWNVEGPDFSQYHGLFEDIYSDIYSSVDPIAENLRKLGEYAPFRLERLNDLKTIDDKAATSNEPKALAKDLLKHNEAMVDKLKSTFDIANTANEQGIANFIAERIDMHQKWVWQLKASTK